MRQDAAIGFGHQPAVAQWNLLQLANALYPLVDDAAPLEAALQRFATDYEQQRLEMMAAKLGLRSADCTDGRRARSRCCS